MPKAFFRILVQFQDPRKFSYIGGPKAFRCPQCQHQWFFDPHLELDCLTVVCKKCETTIDVSKMFLKEFDEI